MPHSVNPGLDVGWITHAGRSSAREQRLPVRPLVRRGGLDDGFPGLEDVVVGGRRAVRTGVAPVVERRRAGGRRAVRTSPSDPSVEEEEERPPDMQTDRRLSRRAFVATAAAGSVTALVSTPRASAAAPSQVHTVGRVREAADGFWQYAWPGVSFEARFRGTGVGVVLDDAHNDYDVQIDGATVATLVTPGKTTHAVDGLAPGEHSVRLVKRTESTWAAGRFGGFTAAAGGEILARPPARSRQIEFVGDSHTVGYGNVSAGRDCSGDGGVHRNTHAGLSFGALTAQGLDADFQLNAYSGLGMVRNYNGGAPDTTYRTYYERALLHADGDVWEKPATWQPQLVVIGLGINDFSTPLAAGERWATQAELVADYASAYHGFLDTLRGRYGPETFLLVVATASGATTAFPDTAERVVEERVSRGDERVGYWYYGDAPLDLLGCDWHPSAADHRVLAGLLTDHLATLPLGW
ncbi:SGNH/GDSL hydrolase family protein [Streptomyces sp. 4N509B]|uniref:SGNH/GDSL hydrolase family protein n=1 Tax=Streptomyces sp. 4N509B TaxID=3457413 RepID=UPI003FD0E1BD